MWLVYTFTLQCCHQMGGHNDGLCNPLFSEQFIKTFEVLVYVWSENYALLLLSFDWGLIRCCPFDKICISNYPKYIRREMTLFPCKEDIILLEGIVKISLWKQNQNGEKSRHFPPRETITFLFLTLQRKKRPALSRKPGVTLKFYTIIHVQNIFRPNLYCVLFRRL